MLAKNRILSALSIIAIILIIGLYTNKTSDSTIETVSAAISIETQDVTASTNGTLSEFKVEQYEKVTPGDTIAIISQKIVSKCKNSTQLDNTSNAAKDYENAAIMYKDGIISQEQYDSSLEKYKKQKNIKKNCSDKIITQSKDVKTTISGKIEFADIEIGDTVNENTVVAKIQTGTPTIIAYISPKYKKQIKAGDLAEINIIKYPEKHFTGKITSIDKIDIYGQAISLSINENVSDLNLKNKDSVVVKINK